MRDWIRTLVDHELNEGTTIVYDRSAPSIGLQTFYGSTLCLSGRPASKTIQEADTMATAYGLPFRITLLYILLFGEDN